MIELLVEFLLNYLPLIAGFILCISYVQQIGLLYKTKETGGISIKFWVILSVALSMLLINAITIFIVFGTWGYMVIELFNVGLALVVLGMVLYYRKKEFDKRKVEEYYNDK